MPELPRALAKEQPDTPEGSVSVVPGFSPAEPPILGRGSESLDTATAQQHMVEYVGSLVSIADTDRPTPAVTSDKLDAIPRLETTDRLIAVEHPIPKDVVETVDRELFAKLLKTDNFRERFAAQRAYEQKALAGGEVYHTASGDYSKDGVIRDSSQPFYAGFAPSEQCSPTDPRRVSNFLGNRIEQLLADATKPVIVLDIGGEFGTTASKLAGRFADAIDGSALAIGVTNLAPSLEGHERFLEGNEPRVVQQAREEAGGRVQYINSSALAMPDQSIRLRNGAEVELRGNVSLAHERASVRYWSLSPGLDIWRLAQIIAPQGMHMVEATDCICPYIYDEQSKASFESRIQEIALAQASLGKLGLTLTRMVDTGKYAGYTTSYLMFSGPDAPLIDV